MEQPDVFYTTRLFLTKPYGRAILWSAGSNVVRRKVTKSLSGRDRIFVGSAWRGIPAPIRMPSSSVGSLKEPKAGFSLSCATCTIAQNRTHLVDQHRRL